MMEIKMFLAKFVSMILAAALLLGAQQQQLPDLSDREKDVKLPSGKSQKDEILKAEYAKTLKDAEELVKTAEDLKAELEKNDRYVLSVTSLKQLDNIEKLTKRMRSRLKH